MEQILLGHFTRNVIQTKTTVLSEFYERLDEFIEKIKVCPPKDQEQMFYSLAPCIMEGAKRRQVGAQKVIPFDIDHIDPSKDPKDYLMAACDALAIDHQKVFAVMSGYGVQIIVLPSEIPTLESKEDYEAYKKSWLKHCESIKSALTARALISEHQEGVNLVTTHVDTTVWSTARFMRMPETWNRKEGRPEKRSFILINNLAPQELNLERLSVGKNQKRAGASNRTSPTDGETTIDNAFVKQECRFLAHALENPKALHHDDIFSAATLLATMKEDVDSFLQSCEGGVSSTANSWDRAKKVQEYTSGTNFGMNCATVESKATHGKCAECPWRGKVTNPLKLTDKVVIGTNKNGNDKINYAVLYHRYVERGSLKVIAGDRGEKYFKYNRDSGLWESNTPLHIKAFAQTQLNNCNNNTANEFFGFATRESAGGSNHTMPWFSQSTEGLHAFSNGVLHIESGEFMPFEEKYGFRSKCDYAYDPNAKDIPLIRKFISELMMKDGGRCLEDEDFWLQIFGEAILGGDLADNSQYFVMHIGERAGNGKSTGKRLIASMFPPAPDPSTAGGLIEVTPHHFNDVNFFKQRMLLGAKIAWLPELSLGGGGNRFNQVDSETYWNEVKKAASGEKLHAAFKGLDQFTFTNTARLHADTNKRPPSTADEGVLRRHKPLEYTNLFREGAGGNAIQNILATLMPERSAFFNVLRETGLELRKSKFNWSRSKRALELEESFKVEGNKVRQWMDEFCLVVPVGPEGNWVMSPEVEAAVRGLGLEYAKNDLGEVSVRIRDLYTKSFVGWCEAQRMFVIGLPKFTELLEKCFSGVEWKLRYSKEAGSRWERQGLGKSAVVRGLICDFSAK